MSSASAPHVVVLDGSPLYADVYHNVFATEGFRVTALTECTVDPAELLRMRPDIVVLDLKCGGDLRGLDLLRRLRADPAGAQVPVLLSTPSSLIDMERFGTELRALGALIFDGMLLIENLLAAARSMTTSAGDL